MSRFRSAAQPSARAGSIAHLAPGENLADGLIADRRAEARSGQDGAETEPAATPNRVAAGYEP